MGDIIGLPCELGIGLQRPCLDKVPPRVAARILDMWRVGGMLARFPDLVRERDRGKRLFQEALSHGRWREIEAKLPVEVCDRGQERFDQISHEFYAPINADQGEAIWVNAWVDTTSVDSQRLSCEAEVVFLHMALEMLPNDDKTIVVKFPLVHCLRRLRNVAVHHKPVDVSQADFSANASDADKPGTQPLTLNFVGSWFLSAKAEDLEATDGPQLPELFRWFEEKCRVYPAWWILQAAVEQLCAYFAMQHS